MEEFIRSFAHEVTNGQGKKERRGSALAKQSNEMGRIKQVHLTTMLTYKACFYRQGRCLVVPNTDY